LLKNSFLFVSKICNLLTILSFLTLFSCALKNVSVLPYPDLAFVSIEQRPTAAVPGKKVQLLVEIENNGTAWAPATRLRLTDQSNHIIEEKEIPRLHPRVNLTIRFDLPPGIAPQNLFLVLDPERRIYEKNRTNNVLQFALRFVSEAEKRKLKSYEDEEYVSALKKSFSDQCESQVILSSLKRTDKTMGYESAYSGETVMFTAVIENRCDKEIYDLSLYWTERSSKERNSQEKIFGQARIEKLLPGEKRILQRSLTAEAGRWYISLRLESEHSSEIRGRYLEPAFILLVEPASE
jgi:hypothetical protein